jgi:voltage-gated potassium channel Kch
MTTSPPQARRNRRPFWPERETRRNLWRGLRVISAAAVALCLLAAAFERWAEPGVFKSYWVALYWAVVTVATVGYGDIVPKTGEGRAAAVVIILFAMGWIPVVTSIVVSTLNQRGEARVLELQAMLQDMSERLKRIEERQTKP